MPKQLVAGLMIEFGLMLSTLFFLIQPNFIFKRIHERTRIALTMSGLIMLCVTFCWSVIFGCILTLHRV